jgi:hypothetical protein
LTAGEKPDEELRKVLLLSPRCMRYIRQNDSLANRIFHSIAELVIQTGGPVKLAEVADAVYGSKQKRKQDSIRLTIDKTLLRCGVVERTKLGPRDVRYFLTAYRFQETQVLETKNGPVTKRVGAVVAVPLRYWPIPSEFFLLKSDQVGYESALAKLDEDLKKGRISKNTYEFERAHLHKLSLRTKEKLESFKAIEDAMRSAGNQSFSSS